MTLFYHTVIKISIAFYIYLIYKNNILAYLVGKLPQEEKNDIPQFNNWEVNNSGIRSQIANKFKIASNFVIIYNNLSSNSND